MKKNDYPFGERLYRHTTEHHRGREQEREDTPARPMPAIPPLAHVCHRLVLAAGHVDRPVKALNLVLENPDDLLALASNVLKVACDAKSFAYRIRLRD